MPKKGSPGYEEWLREYRLKRKKGVEEKEGQQELFPKKVEELTESKTDSESRLVPGPAKVYSKSANKELFVNIIKFDATKNKYLVSREDGKFLYYGKQDLKPILKETKPQVKFEEVVVPKGSGSEKIEKQVAKVAYEISNNGMYVDLALLANMNTKYELKLKYLTDTMKEMGAPDFNPLSASDTKKVLYEDLKLTPVGGNMGTDAKTLSLLSSQSEIPALISEYRSVNRMISAYTSKIPEMISSDGKIRNKLESSTVSGRFKSSGTVKKQMLSAPEDFNLEDKIYTPEELSKIGIQSPCS